jgi:gluconokinase
MSSTSPSQAERPLTLSLDVGTSSVRAELYDSHARVVDGIEGRTRYQMRATPDGGVEIDADHLLSIIAQTIDQCLEETRKALPDLAPGEIAAVGYSNFWHAMLGIDEAGHAITPLYNWSDTRSAPFASQFGQDLGRDWIHQQTGVVPHASYYPAKILWLRATDPTRFRRISRLISIGEYLYAKIFGRLACGVSMASGTGLFDPHRLDWNDEILAAIGIRRDQLSPLATERESFHGMEREWRERWPLLREARWLPAAGDGACSNIGSGCFTERRIAINVGTSGAMRLCWPNSDEATIPPGLWCYRANHRYALVGGALSNGGDAYAWGVQTLHLPDRASIEQQLLALPAASHGLTVLPFFSGERSTGWHDTARAAFLGISLGTRPIDLLQASLEAVCYRFAAIYERFTALVNEETQIIASGGAIVGSPAWARMMADVIGVPVIASAVKEASSRGAAMLAMEAFAEETSGGSRSFDSFPTPTGAMIIPDPTRHRVYVEDRDKHQSFYRLLVEKKQNPEEW